MAHHLLEGKRGVIFGALDSHSLAWQAALKIKAAGGNFVLTNTPVALRLGTIQELGQLCSAPVISADATVVEDIEALFNQAMSALGGKIDFVLHSIGMSPNVRKQRSYGDLNYEWFMKTL